MPPIIAGGSHFHNLLIYLVGKYLFVFFNIGTFSAKFSFHYDNECGFSKANECLLVYTQTIVAIWYTLHGTIAEDEEVIGI